MTMRLLTMGGEALVAWREAGVTTALPDPAPRRVRLAWSSLSARIVGFSGVAVPVCGWSGDGNHAATEDPTGLDWGGGWSWSWSAEVGDRFVERNLNWNAWKD